MPSMCCKHALIMAVLISTYRTVTVVTHVRFWKLIKVARLVSKYNDNGNDEEVHISITQWLKL